MTNLEMAMKNNYEDEEFSELSPVGKIGVIKNTGHYHGVKYAYYTLYEGEDMIGTEYETLQEAHTDAARMS